MDSSIAGAGCLAIMLALLLGLSRDAWAQLPVIELAAIQPTAAQIGTTVEMKVTSGNHLDAIDRLVFSDPRIVAEVLREPAAEPGEAVESGTADGPSGLGPIKSGQFLVTIPSDVLPGRYEVRALGAYGLSNPRVLVITSDPVVPIADVSQTSSEPTDIDQHLGDGGGLVLVHQSTAAAVDYYRFSSPPKDALRLTIDAQRIDSRMIPQLRLFDSQGKLLTLVRGADGFDPSWVIPAQAGQSFTIAINDFLYRGGPNYFYQVRFEPIADADWESGGQLRVSQSLAPPDSLGLVTIDRVERAAIHTQAWNAPPGSIAWLGDIAGGEPVRLTPPCQIAAEFPPPRVARPQPGQAADHHLFDFEAEQGKAYTIEVISHRLGEPSDPRLAIKRLEVKPDQSEVWHAVASEDDQAVVGDVAVRLRSRDPVIAFVAPATATYRIEVRNLDSGTALAFRPAYRLVVREPIAEFSLVAAPAFPHNDPAQSRHWGSQLRRGDTMPVRVLVNRRDGFAGAVAVSASGLPQGVTAQPVTIAANQSDGTLILRASETAGAWDGRIEIVGEAIGEGEPLRTVAIPATFVWGSGEQRDFIRARTTTDLMIAVTDQQATPVSIDLAEKPAESPPAEPQATQPDASTETGASTEQAAGAAGEGSPPLVTVAGKPGTTVAVAVNVVRREGGGGAITLRPRNLPPGVTAADLAIAADKNDGLVELKIAADAKPGTYSLWFLGETKVKFKPITQTDPRELTVFVPSTSVNLELTPAP